MKQRLGLAIVLFCLMPALFAQQKAKQNAREDNASFMFTESQLNEDDDAAQSTSCLLYTSSGIPKESERDKIVIEFMTRF